MVCKNAGIYGFLGAWWVLINMVPLKIFYCTQLQYNCPKLQWAFGLTSATLQTVLMSRYGLVTQLNN